MQQSIPHVNKISFKQLNLIDSHENLVSYLDVEETDKFIYFVMEFCNNGDLQTYIDDNDPLNEEEVRYMLKQLASGLEVLKKYYITHRDLKPSVYT